jgi:FMN phosphatase YigB (HAD superfamily)
VGVAGNQTARAEQLLRDLRLPVDWIGTSSTWGVEKPRPAFFERLAAECGCPPHEIAYVGDRVDNDIVPAYEAGLVTVHVRRGPWGRILSPDTRRSHLVVDDLTGLADRLPLFKPAG